MQGETSDRSGANATLADDDTDQSPAAAVALTRGSEVGRYLLLEKLGAGAMGVVYAAYDPELDRRVALKLLRPGDGADERSSAGRARLLREAQALARLAHPNVVTVFDAGTFTDGDLLPAVYVAMELVLGTTLSRWLGERRRPWREVVAMFLQAGRGLAAAHAAGLVHRDFKPDNVLVGTDGRARVVDFGLARRAGAGELEVDHGGDDGVALRLTRTGAIAGTPAYMAPEQHLGQQPDARTDQFSFCVSLWEALFGRRPFAGSTRLELAANVTRGALSEPPPDASVPAFVRRALAHGLALEPGARHPSMDALLAELERDPARTWRRGAAVVALVAGTSGIVWKLAAGDDVSPCEGSRSALAAVWDEGRRREVEDAFAGTGVSFADEGLKATTEALDRWSEQWLAGHRDACEAHHVRREQSAELLDLRMACLATKKVALAAFVDVIASADAEVVARAPTGAVGLPDVSACADVERLRQAIPPPEDTATRDRVVTVRNTLAQATALGHAGKYARGRDLAEPAHAEAVATGHAPVQAEAGLALADLVYAAGDGERAEALLVDAVAHAIEARDDDVLASATTKLVSVVGVGRSHYDEAERWGRVAGGAVARLGLAGPHAAGLARTMCMMLADRGRAGEALPHCERGLELARELSGPDTLAAASAHTAVGIAQFVGGSYAAADAEFERAYDLMLAIQGPDHPDLATAINSRAAVCFNLRAAGDCVPLFEEAVGAAERAYGRTHPEVADFGNNLAIALVRAGRLEEAEARANDSLAIRREVSGEDHPGVGAALRTLGTIAKDRGDPTRARDLLRRAVDNLRRTRGRGHPDVLETLVLLGEAELAAGDRKSATSACEDALAQAKEAGRSEAEMASTLACIERARAPNGSAIIDP